MEIGQWKSARELCDLPRCDLGLERNLAELEALASGRVPGQNMGACRDARLAGHEPQGFPMVGNCLQTAGVATGYPASHF